MATASQHPNQERRFMGGSVPATRGRTVSGYACLFDVRSNNVSSTSTPMVEVVLPGAFDSVLKDDVRALFNHDANLILARSNNGMGTLKLSVDSRGLKYSFTAPDTSAGNDLLESIRRGDIDQSSYSFSVDASGQKYDMEGKTCVRTIKKFSKLYDVSPVAFAATPETTVTARNAKPGTTGDRPHWTVENATRRFNLLRNRYSK